MKSNNCRRVGAEPDVLRLERLCIEVRRFGAARTDALVVEFVGISLRGDVAAGKGRYEFGKASSHRLDVNTYPGTGSGRESLPPEIQCLDALGDAARVALE